MIIFKWNTSPQKKKSLLINIFDFKKSVLDALDCKLQTMNVQLF